MNIQELIETIFKPLLDLGASVMMPIIFIIIGLCLRVKFSTAVKSGLYVGVGFIGLGIVTDLLTTNLGPAVNALVAKYGLQLSILDIGWPAAAGAAYDTSVGMLIIPACLLVNLLMLVTKTTKTINIDIWNFWHHAFIGSLVYVATGNVLWGLLAGLICFVISLVIADFTAPSLSKFYDNMDGISIPQPFCAAYVPFAVAINKLLDMIPGINKIDIDAEGLKKKFGLLGEPIFLGVIIGSGLALLAGYDIPKTLKLGVIMGAVMELIPRVTRLFIDGLIPISEATKKIVDKKFTKSSGFYIGMSPALVIGHPTTLVVSLLLIPAILFLSIVLPGNKFLPLTSLAGLLYIFPLVLPITKGNVLKTFIVGLLMLVLGNYLITGLAMVFTEVVLASESYKQVVPTDTLVGSIDFTGSPLNWVIYQLMNLKAPGIIALTLSTLALVYSNRKRNVLIKKIK